MAAPPARRSLQPRPETARRREEILRALKAAEKAGGIALVYERGASHLVDKVRLADPAALYAHLGEETAGMRVDRLVSAFEGAFQPSTAEGREVQTLLREGIAGRRTVCGIAPDDTAKAVETLMVADGVYGRDPGDRAPLRAFSTARFGDSKLVGRSWRRVCQVLRQLDLAQDEEAETDEDIALRLGLRRSTPLVCVAGPLSAPGVDLGAIGLAGLTETVAVSLAPSRPVSSALVVENWESFRRHVDEARRPDEVVVYAGGWPSRAVQTALQALSRRLCCPFLHWGDIDPAGLRIADAVGSLVGGIVPHLMTAELAMEHGTGSMAGRRPPRLPEASPLSGLAAYLGGPDARTLEQEILNPAPVATGTG